MADDDGDGGRLHRRGRGPGDFEHDGADHTPGSAVPGRATSIRSRTAAHPAAVAQRAIRTAEGAASQIEKLTVPLRTATAAADYAESGRLAFEVRSAARRAETALASVENSDLGGELARDIATARARIAIAIGQAAPLLQAAPSLEDAGAGSEEAEGTWRRQRGATAAPVQPSWADEVRELAPRVGLGTVDVHADDTARAITDAEGARGVAHGGAIYLHPDRIQPGTPDGREVLAHELVHLRQARQPGRRASERFDAESEAAALAPLVVRGESVVPEESIELDAPAADTHARRSRNKPRRSPREAETSHAEALAVSKTKVKLPDTPVGQSAKPKLLQIFNHGPVPVELGDVRAVDARTEAIFPVYAPALEPIEPGAAAEVSIGFQPNEQKMLRGTIQVLDAEGAIAASVAVRGRGVSLERAAHVAIDRGKDVSVETYAEMLAALRVATQLADHDDPAERRKALELVSKVDQRLDAITGKVHREAASYGHSGSPFSRVWGHATTAVKVYWRGIDDDNRPRDGEYVVRTFEVAGEIIRVGTGEAARAKTLDKMNVGQVLVDMAQYGAGFLLGAIKGAGEAIVDVVKGAAGMIRTVVKTLYDALLGDWSAIYDMLAGWVEKIRLLIERRGELAAEIGAKWNATSDWDRGLYQGEVLGWVMMTVAIAALTMGGSLAGVGGRFANVLRALEQLAALGDAFAWARAAVKAPGKLLRIGDEALGGAAAAASASSATEAGAGLASREVSGATAAAEAPHNAAPAHGPDSHHPAESDAGSATHADGQAKERKRSADEPDTGRAARRAKVAAELSEIRVSVAETGHTSRGYLVARGDGQRMAKLFAMLDDVEVIAYKEGLLVRHEGKEWYFQFDDAVRPGAADMSGPRDPLNGLPAPNIATVELVGYRGVRHIEGRKVDISKKNIEGRALTKDEQDVMDAKEEDALIYAGHVAMSFDGGKTLYGMTPQPPPGMKTPEVVDRLMKGEIFPGRVKLDNDHFETAIEKARDHGWDTEPVRAIISFDVAEQPFLFERVMDEIAANRRGEHIHAYQFPQREPPYHASGTANNGQQYTEDNIGSCAKYPQMVGVPVPHPGRMKDYIPGLIEWAKADAPIAGHEHLAKKGRTQ